MCRLTLARALRPELHGIVFRIIVTPAVIIVLADFTGRELVRLLFPSIEHLRQLIRRFAVVFADFPQKKSSLDRMKCLPIVMIKKKTYSQTYLKTLHNQLSAIFNHAVRYYELRPNPAAKVRNMGDEEHREMLFWTKEKYKKFAFETMDKSVSFTPLKCPTGAVSVRASCWR